MSGWLREYAVTVVLVAVVLSLSIITLAGSRPMQPEGLDNIGYDRSTNTLNLSTLTLRQKIAQMIVVYADGNNRERLQDMLVGGIYLVAMPTKEDFTNQISDFQENTTVPFFVTVDLEGCWNPFESFQEFPSLSEIESEEEAYLVGLEEGRFLKEMGFSINFAPVVDLNDTIWKCRSFGGSVEEVSGKANAYIMGLQEEGIIATAKHYPGKTLIVDDSHKYLTYALIEFADVAPFMVTFKNNVSAVMVSHLIVEGSLDSGSKPADTSEVIGRSLRNKFSGLIVSDEINMRGLKDFYPEDEARYVALFQADNDLILDFSNDMQGLDNLILVVERAVREGRISEGRIDDSVERILSFKGINVAR